MMTEKQILLVKRSWKILSKINPALVGDVFYTRLFLEVPSLKHLFTTDRKLQAQKLVDMLTAIVAGIDRPQEQQQQQDIRQLALRHQQYGALPWHYQKAGEALLWTLEHGLGADYTPEVKEAWQACYRQVVEKMLSYAQQVK
jgi:hemoglobin-like flavoprotein